MSTPDYFRLHNQHHLLPASHHSQGNTLSHTRSWEKNIKELTSAHRNHSTASPSLAHGRRIFHEQTPVIDKLICQLIVDTIEDSHPEVSHVGLCGQMHTFEITLAASKSTKLNLEKCGKMLFQLLKILMNVKGCEGFCENQSSKSIMYSTCTRHLPLEQRKSPALTTTELSNFHRLKQPSVIHSFLAFTKVGWQSQSSAGLGY